MKTDHTKWNNLSRASFYDVDKLSISDHRFEIVQKYLQDNFQRLLSERIGFRYAISHINV